MEFTPSSPIAIKSTSDSFEASSYLSSFAESYRRSNGYAFERRISNTATVFISRSPEQSPIRRESIEIPQEIYEQAPLLDYDESSTPKSSTYESIFNATNILMGIGILSLPYALKLTGWMIGLTLLLLFSLATRHTAMTVQKCMDAVVPDHLLFDQCRTFGDFGEVAFGTIGRRIISVIFQLELFAASVALVILSADSIVALFPNLVPNYVKAGAVLVIMPMTFFKSLKFASYGSFFGILALTNLIIIILCDGFSTNEAPGSILSPSETSIYPTSWLKIPIAFGLIMSGFSGQYYFLALKYSSVFPSLYRDMKNPKAYPIMVNLTYIFTTFTYILIAVSGYLMFGNDVEEEITLSLPNSFINRGTIWLIALNPLTKYPLTIHPLNIELELWMKSKFGSIWSVLISRILISSLVLCVSILVPGFDLIMSILGSTFSFTVSIVFPELCFNKLYTLTKVQKLVSWSLITMGISLAVIGTLWPFII